MGTRFEILFAMSHWVIFFNLAVEYCAIKVSSLGNVVIDVLLPARKYQFQPQSLFSLTPGYWVAVDQGNRFIQLLHSKISDHRRRLFVCALNDCKLLGDRMRQRLSAHKFDSRDYWRLFQAVFGKNKSSISSSPQSDWSIDNDCRWSRFTGNFLTTRQEYRCLPFLLEVWRSKSVVNWDNKWFANLNTSKRLNF